MPSLRKSVKRCQDKEYEDPAELSLWWRIIIVIAVASVAGLFAALIPPRVLDDLQGSDLTRLKGVGVVLASLIVIFILLWVLPTQPKRGHAHVERMKHLAVSMLTAVGSALVITAVMWAATVEDVDNSILACVAIIVLVVCAVLILLYILVSRGKEV